MDTVNKLKCPCVTGELVRKMEALSFFDEEVNRDLLFLSVHDAILFIQHQNSIGYEDNPLALSREDGVGRKKPAVIFYLMSFHIWTGKKKSKHKFKSICCYIIFYSLILEAYKECLTCKGWFISTGIRRRSFLIVSTCVFLLKNCLLNILIEHFIFGNKSPET